MAGKLKVAQLCLLCQWLLFAFLSPPIQVGKCRGFSKWSWSAGSISYPVRNWRRFFPILCAFSLLAWVGGDEGIVRALWDTDHFSAVGFLQHLLPWKGFWGTLTQKMASYGRGRVSPERPAKFSREEAECKCWGELHLTYGWEVSACRLQLVRDERRGPSCW